MSAFSLYVMPPFLYRPALARTRAAGAMAGLSTPLSVIVDLASLFPVGPGLSNTQALKITKGGLLLTGYATGEAWAWA